MATMVWARLEQNHPKTCELEKQFISLWKGEGDNEFCVLVDVHAAVYVCVCVCVCMCMCAVVFCLCVGVHVGVLCMCLHA